MPNNASVESCDPKTDPTPWRSVDGVRVSDPFAPESPRGGYTFEPLVCYSDYPAGFVSSTSRRAAALKRIARHHGH